MKIDTTFKVSINSGAALLLFILAFFILLLGVAFFPPVEKNFIAAGTILVGAFAGYLKKRDSNNAKTLDLDKAKLACDAGKGVGQE